MQRRCSPPLSDRDCPRADSPQSTDSTRSDSDVGGDGWRLSEPSVVVVAKRPAHGEPVRFAELAVPGSGSRGAGVAGQFEVVLGNGRMVRVGPSFDADALRHLVRILEAADG